MTSKTQARLNRQERARAMREQERAAARRQRTLLVSGVVAAVIVIAVAIGLIAGSSSGGGSGTSAAPPDAVSGGGKIPAGGLLIGKSSAPVTVDAYEDFTCPICGEFESTSGSTVFAAADAYYGADKALAMHTVLYAHQPSETSKTGLTDAQILQYAASVGITSQKFVDAVHNKTFMGWVNKVADDASKAGVNATPTIYLNGKSVDIKTLVDANQNFDPTKFTAAVDAAKKTPAT